MCSISLSLWAVSSRPKAATGLVRVLYSLWFECATHDKSTTSYLQAQFKSLHSEQICAIAPVISRLGSVPYHWVSRLYHQETQGSHWTLVGFVLRYSIANIFNVSHLASSEFFSLHTTSAATFFFSLPFSESDVSTGGPVLTMRPLWDHLIALRSADAVSSVYTSALPCCYWLKDRKWLVKDFWKLVSMKTLVILIKLKKICVYFYFHVNNIIFDIYLNPWWIEHNCYLQLLVK